MQKFKESFIIIAMDLKTAYGNSMSVLIETQAFYAIFMKFVILAKTETVNLPYEYFKLWSLVVYEF